MPITEDIELIPQPRAQELRSAKKIGEPKKQLRSPRQFLVPEEEEEPAGEEEKPKKGRAELRKEIQQKKEQEQKKGKGENSLNGLMPGLAGLDLAK